MSEILSTFKFRWMENEQNILNLYKDSSLVISMCTEIKSLDEQDCFELIGEIKNNGYFFEIIRIYCLNKIGNVKELKTNLCRLSQKLLDLKKYNRIVELQEIANIFQIKDKDFHMFIETTKLRKGDILSVSEDYDFHDVVNNSNIYFSKVNIIDSFYRLTEVFNLRPFVNATFLGIKQLHDSTFALDSLIRLTRNTKNKRLIKVLREHYQIIDIEAHEDKRKKQLNDLNNIAENNWKRSGTDHLLEIGKLREEINAESVSNDFFKIIVRRIILRYQTMGMDEQARKLSKYLKQHDKRRVEDLE